MVNKYNRRMSESPAHRRIYQHALHFTVLLILSFWSGRCVPSSLVIEILPIHLGLTKVCPAPLTPDKAFHIAHQLLSLFSVSLLFLFISPLEHTPCSICFTVPDVCIFQAQETQPFLAVLLRPHTLSCGSRNTKRPTGNQ